MTVYALNEMLSDENLLTYRMSMSDFEFKNHFQHKTIVGFVKVTSDNPKVINECIQTDRGLFLPIRKALSDAIWFSGWNYSSDFHIEEVHRRIIETETVYFTEKLAPRFNPI